VSDQLPDLGIDSWVDAFGKPVAPEFFSFALSRQRELDHVAQAARESLNENWFLSLDDARLKVESWRRHYNGERPHSALGYLAPREFAGSHSQSGTGSGTSARPGFTRP